MDKAAFERARELQVVIGEANSVIAKIQGLATAYEIRITTPQNSSADITIKDAVLISSVLRPALNHWLDLKDKFQREFDAL